MFTLNIPRVPDDPCLDIPKYKRLNKSYDKKIIKLPLNIKYIINNYIPLYYLEFEDVAGLKLTEENYKKKYKSLIKTTSEKPDKYTYKDIAEYMASKCKCGKFGRYIHMIFRPYSSNNYVFIFTSCNFSPLCYDGCFVSANGSIYMIFATETINTDYIATFTVRTILKN